ncbi:HNH endonuclease [Rubrobacter marinus]|uniref:HNH endonuclease n=1 Tax=Rubrobacter marinus TaxID=2653852 RepID=A0A6G8PT30_9ACTN|nr:HNH endonuclease [Rubrobacter marinus]QIN77504.1 HNH endonuclease [Rubrobacter marinus]
MPSIPMNLGTDDYAHLFARLRTNRNRKVWSELTAHQAPHKPILLLCVLDLFDSGGFSSNLVEISEDIAELFGRYWERILPFGRTGNLALPFFHLRSEEFWHLLPRNEAAGIGPQITSLARLREEVIGARLDGELYDAIRSKENRDRLRSVLIETYFSPEARRPLVEQSAINRGAFVYSEELLKRPRDPKVQETLSIEEAYRPAVRDGGFRRAIVNAYSHRCALCGIRVRTLDGRTAVAAAHIVPWSETQDDRPANGLALCRTCHWTFDEGLLGVSQSYEVLASRQLGVPDNLPGYLTSLEGRAIFHPSAEAHRPDLRSLEWHRENVLR